ncbi:Glycoside hydrolase [Rhypophila decipiens]
MQPLTKLASLTLHLLAITPSVLSSPLSTPQVPRDTTAALKPGNGTHNGYFYTYWTDNSSGSVSYSNKDPGGSYAVSWKNVSNFYGGKGWGPSSAPPSTISYSAKFATSGNAYLSVYGMTRYSPANKNGGLVEFYIMENYGTYDPSTAFSPTNSGTDGGLVEVDGGEYRVGMTRHYYWSPLPGTGSSMVLRVYSVRKGDQKRTKGKVDLKKHFDAWRQKLNVDIGASEKFDFVIVAVEGYQSSGEAEVVVSGV